ncbi:hypothetical protein LUZ60_015983 [Juncus effusus]|nr:hypothetical protein LUZ60_015983 [Juncus effusus]
MDELEEGIRVCSPPCNKGLHSLFFLHEIQDEIYMRLVESGNQEAVSNPRLKEDLDEHFGRLPASYALDVHGDKAEDVLLHKNILAQSAIKENRPVLHVRFLKYTRQAPDETESDDDTPLFNAHKSELPPNLMKDNETVPLHEIIFSSLDKPKILSQLSALLSELGLNIREAHVFSTLDGFCLDVFVVDGWPVEETDGVYRWLVLDAGFTAMPSNFSRQ